MEEGNQIASSHVSGDFSSDILSMLFMIGLSTKVTGNEIFEKMTSNNVSTLRITFDQTIILHRYANSNYIPSKTYTYA